MACGGGDREPTVWNNSRSAESKQPSPINAFAGAFAERCLEVERAFLAACIFDPKQAQAVSDRLTGDHFTNSGYWHLYCCIVEAASRGTDPTVADLGELAAMAEVDMSQSDLWTLLDQQWDAQGDKLPMLADTLIDLAAQEDQLRYHMAEVSRIAGTVSWDRILTNPQTHKLRVPDRLSRKKKYVRRKTAV